MMLIKIRAVRTAMTTGDSSEGCDQEDNGAENC